MSTTHGGTPPWMQPTISADIAKKIIELRQLFAEIPDDLNTDYNLRRWIIENETVAETKRQMKEYIRNRHAAGFDDPNLLSNWMTTPMCQKLLKFFAISLKIDNFDAKSGTIVVVAKIEGSDYRKFFDVASAYEFSSITFLASEVVFQEVQRREAATGRPCGVSILVDMGGLMRYFKDCLNPYSTMNLYFSCASEFVQFYPRLLRNITGINGSFLATAVSKMTVVKNLFENQIHANFRLVNRKEVLDMFDAACIPKAYGGVWRETAAAYPGLDMDSNGCVLRAATLEGVGFPLVWKPSKPEQSAQDVLPNSHLRVVRKVKAPNYRLQWYFHCSSELSFCIYYTKVYSKEDDRSDWTRLRMKCPVVTVNVDESGEFNCERTGNGDYILVFGNSHPSQRVLLTYGARMIPL